MQARSIRIKGSPQRVDEGIEAFKTIAVPRVKEQPGYAGLRLMVDRDSGSALVVGFWQDKEALDASLETLRDLRTEIAGKWGAGQPTIENFEAAVQHRPKPTEAGNWVRITTLQGDPARVDEGIRHFETVTIPAVERLAGFRGAVLLVDRGSGNSLVATIWDSKQDLEQSAKDAAPLRSDAAQAIGATGTPQVEAFEVVYAELLTPVAR